ncbi:MAG TPA: MTH938/NDUFAF3 family protein [Actinomycetota bacterium]|nr:MTH938/NDUFAF3 family protein [Actinomycetota bacterium]
MTKIEDYRFGHLTVDGREHTKDVIVLPGRVVAGWWRRDGHGLVLEDLADVAEELPERLIVGTGHDGRMRPDPQAIAALESRGIHVEVLRTTEAVGRYGQLDPTTTAAALHLTC